MRQDEAVAKGLVSIADWGLRTADWRGKAGRCVAAAKGRVKVPGYYRRDPQIGLLEPSRQVLAYYPDGAIRIWSDRNAQDSEAAKARYSHSFYRANQRLAATGYNLINLAGL